MEENQEVEFYIFTPAMCDHFTSGDAQSAQ